MQQLKTLVAALALAAAGATHAGPTITGTASSATLATTIAGAGITINSASLSYDGGTTPYAAGTFTGGASTVGFDSGIVLTTGDIACATGANDSNFCGLDRSGVATANTPGVQNDTTTLKLNFSSATGSIFFQYVFASEEYNEYANSQYNDGFKLLLDGVNIAKIGTEDVTINNVNCIDNSGFYRNNKNDGVTGCGPSLNLDIQYDGLTVVLTASGTVAAGNHDFEFTIFDVSDGIYDSGVFIKAGSFSGVNQDVPEPGTLALAGLALLGMVGLRRKARG